MAKRGTEFISERPMAKGVADHKAAVIRVRRISEWGGKAHYYMDGWPLPVPPVLRHLDGRTWRGVALALAVALGVGAWAMWRLVGGAR